VHRVVLTAMNNEVLDLGEQRGDECFVQWKYASSIFTLLGMMLRAPVSAESVELCKSRNDKI
jgi:hypothetical protein